MLRPHARYLPDATGEKRRLHLQHGPIDLIIGLDGSVEAREQAFMAATERFQSVLAELVCELPFLRGAAFPAMPWPDGSTAGRMVAAVRPLSADRFLTPMAAVAGAVADEVLCAMLAGFPAADRPCRIYVNNGGDIALHLAGDATFRIKIAREDSATLGYFQLDAVSPSRGIATSGRGGRSLSMGIADSVTVLARNAAEADAAATLVANAVDLPGHPLIVRARAIDMVDESDLGERLVVRSCGVLPPGDVNEALSRGVFEADRLISLGLIEKAALFLQDRGRLAGGPDIRSDRPAGVVRQISMERTEHA